MAILWDKIIVSSITFQVMLHIILLSTFYLLKIDMALKITIGSKFNNDPS
jgi:hypothetical protein